jgi:hypothetical protein
MNWFRNLKKWQKGGLIGLVIGVILGPLALYLMVWGLCPHVVYTWVFYTHLLLVISVSFINGFYNSVFGFSPTFFELKDMMSSIAILVFYGGLGAIAGLIQQSAKPFIKWPLTGLLALLLLLFYLSSLLMILLLSGVQYP